MSKYSTNSELQKFEELLTPYIQGRLDEVTRRKVEQYAESSADFAELLQFEQRVAANVRNSSAETVTVMPSFANLKQRIETEAKPNHGFEVFFTSIVNAVRGLNPGLVMASLALVAIALLTLQRSDITSFDDRFETLSDNGSDVVAVPGRKYFNVVFDESANAKAIEQLASELKFDVETGPNSIGAYTVSIEVDDQTPEAALAKWRADNRFVLVQPTSVPEAQ